MSLSVGPRQKFGTGPLTSSSRPFTRYDASVPVDLSRTTSMSRPLIRTRASVSSRSRAGSVSGAGSAGAGVCQSRASCSAATVCPASAQLAFAFSTKETFSQYSAPGSGFCGFR